MARKKFTDEQKAAFLAAVHEYVAKGWSAGSAYKQVAADYAQEGKPVPNHANFYRWMAREKRESGGKAANRPTCPTSPTGPTGPTNAEAEADADADPEESASDPDYTHRLELIVRLYRTRSEAAVDAVCDRLLPELAEEE